LRVPPCFGALRRVLIGYVLPALLLAGCDRANMVAQDKARQWDESPFFANKSSMREPVAGTVARDAPNEPAPQPAVITASLVARGRDEFNIFCSPCHGQSGDGKGMIVQRGFPEPPPLWLPRLEQAKATYIYDVITNGHGVMYSYADRVKSKDRWAVVAYVRALQQSQDAKPANLPDDDRALLEAAK
jgi:mono/diheme cytochrome c family protein